MTAAGARVAAGRHGGRRRGQAIHAVVTTVVATVVVILGGTAGLAGATSPVAPVVTLQPISQGAMAGNTLTFSAAASGSPTPTVQWQLSVDGGSSWGNVSGLTSTSFTTGPLTDLANGWEVRAVFTNAGGSAASNAATITIVPGVAPFVFEPPTSQTAIAGNTLTFSAAASGSPTPTVQWQLSVDGGSSWGNVSGLTSTSFTTGPLSLLENGWEVRAIFTNAAGSATSSAATMTVVTAEAPVMYEQPTSMTVPVGGSVVFTAIATGFPTPTVQWQVSLNGGAAWGDISGATSINLVTGTLSNLENGWELRAVFTNASGSATSNAATITMVPAVAPVVTLQPISQTGSAGATLTFSAAASGSPTPTVQWQLSVDGGSSWGNVSGLTSASFTAGPLTALANGWEVRAVFTNAGGSATSTAATILIASTAVFSWGEGSLGELGNGTDTAVQPLPAPINGVGHVVALSAGGNFALALLSNGTVEAWGENTYGQLGNGTTTTSNTAVMVSGLSGVTAVAAGSNFALALLSNGTVYSWGQGGAGNLGAGTLGGAESCANGATCTTTPTLVSGLSGVTAISAGDQFALALLHNGTVDAWGYNGDGELGLGTDTGPLACGSVGCSDTPMPVPGLTGVTAIAAGDNHDLVLLQNGTLEAWGDNSFSELGTGTVNGPQTTPVAVPGLTGISAIAAGEGQDLALTTTGVLDTWGLDSGTPVAVLSGVQAMTSSDSDILSLALLSNGTADAWGYNGFGELGNGTVDGSFDPPPASLTTPGPVSGLTGVIGLAAGADFGLALT
jgi:alpha-tubulin suppressor-like RCC1 family protein